MRYSLTRIGVHRTALIVAVIYGLFSLVLFPVFYIVSRGEGQGALPGIVAILGPVLYTALSYVVTALFCWVYNLIAPRLGGIPMTLEADTAAGQ